MNSFPFDSHFSSNSAHIPLSNSPCIVAPSQGWWLIVWQCLSPLKLLPRDLALIKEESSPLAHLISSSKIIGFFFVPEVPSPFPPIKSRATGSYPIKTLCHRSAPFCAKLDPAITPHHICHKNIGVSRPIPELPLGTSFFKNSQTFP